MKRGHAAEVHSSGPSSGGRGFHVTSGVWVLLLSGVARASFIASSVSSNSDVLSSRHYTASSHQRQQPLYKRNLVQDVYRDVRVCAEARPKPLSREEERELFNRNIAFFGEEGFERIQGAYVTVIGLGGVGSHAVHMLARSGVSKLKIVDFDVVTLSSLNRHALATYADVGLPKCSVMRDRLQAIVPNCEIEAVKEVFTADKAEALLGDKPDYVFDCIDNVNTKADLIGYCQNNGMRVITSLGAGLKADPTRLCIAQLDNAKHDPLAVRLRHFLRKKGFRVGEVTAVYSTELQRGKLIKPSDDEIHNKPEAVGAHLMIHNKPEADTSKLPPNLRLGVMPVLGTMPAIFGDAMAAFVLCELAEQPILPTPVEGLGRHIKHRMLHHLRNREKNTYQWEGDVDVVISDLEEVITNVWARRCVATGRRLGEGSTFALTRWDRSKPAKVDNLILLAGSDIADQFDQQGPAMLTEAQRRFVEDRLTQLFHTDL